MRKSMATVSLVAVLAGCAGNVVLDDESKKRIQKRVQQGQQEVIEETVGAVVDVGVQGAKAFGEEVRRVPKNIRKLSK